MSISKNRKQLFLTDYSSSSRIVLQHNPNGLVSSDSTVGSEVQNVHFNKHIAKENANAQYIWCTSLDGLVFLALVCVLVDFAVF